MLSTRISSTKSKEMSTYKYSWYRESFLEQNYTLLVAKYLSKYTPSWASPNLITISNCLFGSSLAWIFILFYFPIPILKNFQSHTTRDIVLILNIIYTQIYLYLDALDGLQARILNYSTSVGEVLDHTLDAYSSMVMTSMTFWAFEGKIKFFSIPLILLFKIEFLRINVEAYFTDIIREEALGSTEGMMIQTIVLTLSLYFKHVSDKYLNLFSKLAGIIVGFLLMLRTFEYSSIFYNFREKSKKIIFSFYYVILVYGLILYKWNAGGRVMTVNLWMGLVQECPIFLLIMFNLILCKRGKEAGLDLFRNNFLLNAAMISVVVNVLWVENFWVKVCLMLGCCFYGIGQYCVYVHDLLLHEGKTLLWVTK